MGIRSVYSDGSLNSYWMIVPATNRIKDVLVWSKELDLNNL